MAAGEILLSTIALAASRRTKGGAGRGRKAQGGGGEGCAAARAGAGRRKAQGRRGGGRESEQGRKGRGRGGQGRKRGCEKCGGTRDLILCVVAPCCGVARQASRGDTNEENARLRRENERLRQVIDVLVLGDFAMGGRGVA